MIPPLPPPPPPPPQKKLVPTLLTFNSLDLQLNVVTLHTAWVKLMVVNC